MSANNEIQRVRVNRNVWKTSLAKEIIHLEDNLDQIYYTAGLKPHRIVREEENDENPVVDSDKGVTHELRDYASIIDEQVDEIDQAANNICALINSVTEFDLPIPVLVLLKLANRIGSIRCPDFKKKVPGTLAKKYIHNRRSLNLISTSLTLYEWVSAILLTNILPFQPFINQNLFNLLAWTRTSNLCEHNEEQYYTIRLQALGIITKMIEQLSLNFNLDSKQLATLIEDELMDGLDQLINIRRKISAAQKNASGISSNSLPLANGYANEKHQNTAITETEASIENKYACAVLRCLDKLFIVYVDFLDAKLESKLKNFVMQTCIKIYRDFDHDVIGVACRRQLLHLLETIANRPFATSTTELAWHIFELCDKVESDPEIRYIARRSIKIGLCHRPIVVSHFDVHDCYARKCDIEMNNDSGAIATIQPMDNSDNAIEVEDQREPQLALEHQPQPQPEAEPNPEPRTVAEQNSAEIVEIEEEEEEKEKDMEKTSEINIVASIENKQASSKDEIGSKASEQNGFSNTGEIMDEDERVVGDKVDSNENGLVDESEKIATIENKQVDKQETHKVDSVEDRRAGESDKADESGDDEQVKPYLDLFVDSLVTNVMEK